MDDKKFVPPFGWETYTEERMEEIHDQLKLEAKPIAIELKNIDEAYDFLTKCRKQGKIIYIEFNGAKLYSFYTLDDCYKEALGISKDEMDKKIKEEQILLKRNKNLGEEKSDNTKYSSRFDRGMKIIYPQLQKEWEKEVYSRKQDFYLEKEIDSALTVMEALKDGKSCQEAYDALRACNIKGGIVDTVLNLVLNFSNRGAEFMRWYIREIDEFDISEKEEASLKKYEDRNAKFEEENLDIPEND